MITPILLATANPELARRAQATLAELESITVVAHTTDGQLLDAMVERYQPQVVLLDEHLGPLPAVDLTRQLSRNHPTIGVVQLSTHVDESALRRALSAGARAVVAANLDLTLVQGAIDAAVAWTDFAARGAGTTTTGLGDGAIGRPHGRVLALAGAKGGVGVTTLSIALAHHVLAERPGASVCLVEFDLLCGDLPAYLDLAGGRSVIDLLGVAGEATSRHIDETLYRHESGLRFLLAPPNGEDGEDVTADAARHIIQALKARFDVVLVDCGAVLNEAGSAAVELADQVVVVATPDVPALLGARRQADLWHRLDLRARDEIRLVLNRVAKRDEVQPRLIDHVAGMSRLETTVPARFRALEASLNRRSLQPRTDGRYGKATAALADELGLVAEPAPSRRFRLASRPVHLASVPPAQEPAPTLVPPPPTPLSTPTATSPMPTPTPMPPPPRHLRGVSGQATLESAGVLMVVMMVLALILQAVMAGYAFNLAGGAARAGARAAAVGQTSSVENAATNNLPGGWAQRATVSQANPTDNTGEARVTVHLDVPFLITNWTSPLTVSATATMPREQR